MTRIYTANIADTVMFRNLGKDPSPRLQSLKSAVEEAGTEIWVPAAVYHELADTGGGDQPTNPYLDTAIEEGWVRVATPLSGDRPDDFDSTAGAVEKARFVADAFLNQQSKYPETNNWRDAALVALAVRLFDQNARIRVITHTADKNLATACARIPPEFGYYDVQSRYYNPPQTAKAEFPTVDRLTWDGPE
ncbi:hypothetical protein C435_15137 [Haloarcula marismortui ATCC 33799]|uniref:PIN domain-containing protein n=1 Tax=Haloarcula marismortui ATCC 33799 TaxID=662475 RepID=M0K0V8_9EURY|nr:hypothetical protein [Haloarcula californiae]EMA14846.1 hypothetical protein C435_15137 [Haloarcula californiae ATCC 33799]